MIRLAFVTRLFEDVVRPLAKKVHGVRAVSAKTEYGMPSDGIFASLPKKIVKISHGEQRLQNRPRHPQGRLFVADFDLPPGQEVEQFPMRPKFPELEGSPSAGRALFL